MSCAEMAKSVDMPFGRDSGGFREREGDEIPPPQSQGEYTHWFCGQIKGGA